nr:uncharacterized protein LOC112009226 [Quercus suber]
MVGKLGGKAVEIFSDSGLVVGQVKGELEARDTRMQEYLSQVRHIQAKFEFFKVTHVSRSGNAHADSLATLATSSAQHLPRMIMVEDLGTPTRGITEMLQVNQVNLARNWMDPIILFLEKDTLPEDKSEAEKIRRKAPRFWLSEDKKLYKRFYSRPYMFCVRPEASEDLLEELHEGICGSHTGGRSLSHRAITQGYWWPGMQKEAQEYVRKCDQCQRAVGNKKYLLVGTDYFTKWVEAEPLANIRDVDVKRFLLRNIITRFGVPQALISDNGLQFDSKAFRRYCADLGIKNRTTPRRSTGETPFSMTYGAEAVIPIETGFPTLKTSNFTPDGNDELLRKSLDLIDERREKAMVQLAYYQHKLKQGYDANVKLRPLSPGDLVLRKNEWKY